MNRCRALAPLALAVLAAACDSGAPAPGPAGGARRPRFAFVSNNYSPFWAIAQKGLEKAQQEFGIDVDFRYPRGGKQRDDQRRILEELLAQGVDGVAVSPIDPDNMVDLLNRAAAKVPLICQDSDAPKSNRLCYIGTDNYKAGREAGKAMKAALGEAGGTIALFVGRLDAQNAQERRQGFVDETQGAKIEVIQNYLDYTDAAKCEQRAVEALSAYPDLAGLLGLWSYNGPRLAAAVRAAGKAGKVKIVCFDEDEATLQAVKDGIIQATIVQKPFEFGYQSMRLLKAIRDGKASEAIPPGRVIDLGVETITRENVDAFWAQLKERTK